MSELKARHIVDVYDDYARNPFGERSQVYIKSEADKVIADLEESHKKEVDQLLIEIEKLKNIDSNNRSAYYKDLAIMAKDVEHHKHKRCLAMASKCRLRARWFGNNSLYKKEKWALKWHRIWLKLAEKIHEEEAK